MSIPSWDNVLIQTKLHRPPLPVEPVRRPRLTGWLDQRRERPLTLVSAPAGYGKSTLISGWVEILDCPSAWISLDQYDNDMVVFLGYFIAAVHSMFPGQLSKTQAMLRAPELPPLRYLSSLLINELNEIGEQFVLVLDDYYMIHLPIIHDLLNDLIQYAPISMHLVLSTRLDPPLSLAKLRAKSYITEIRSQDLCFTEEETYSLLRKILGTQVDRDEANQLVAQSEGWVTGIRLAALALRHRKGKERVEGQLTANNRYVMDYLVSEILENQIAEFSEWLLKTSILERFCAASCEAVCAPENDTGESNINGQAFLNWLDASNLFVIRLDDQGQWFRYHHLFGDFLQGELERRLDADEIAVLHCSASGWYADRGLIEEALRHALAAGDVISAADLVEQNRYKILKTALWPILENWLNQLPDEIVGQRQALLMAKAWVSSFQGAFEKIPPILQTMAGLLETQTIENDLAGDLDFFKGVLLFWEGQIEPSVELFRHAVERIPGENLGGRNEAEFYFALARQMAGQGEVVTQKYQQMLQSETADSPRYGYLLAALATLHLLSGKLGMVYEVAQQLAAWAAKTQNDIFGGWGYYLMGYMDYEWHNLEKASDHFAQAVEKRYFLDVNVPIDCYAGLIFSYQLMGHPDKANKAVNQMLEFAEQLKNPGLVSLARSVQARQSLLQGDLGSAARWLETADNSSEADIMLFWLEQPRITQCRVLVAKGSKTSLRVAAERLQEYWAFCQATHNTSRMIEILLLQALVYFKQAQIDEALTALERAVNLAQPGGYIRPFVGLGPEFVSLLDQLRSQGVAQDYIGQILAAFPSDAGLPEGKITQGQSQNKNLIDPLTNRESDILELLGERLTNKEIAAQLVITPGTVEQHLVNIYAKLEVGERRQAVAKAEELGLLPTR